MARCRPRDRRAGRGAASSSGPSCARWPGCDWRHGTAAAWRPTLEARARRRSWTRVRREYEAKHRRPAMRTIRGDRAAAGRRAHAGHGARPGRWRAAAVAAGTLSAPPADAGADCRAGRDAAPRRRTSRLTGCERARVRPRPAAAATAAPAATAEAERRRRSRRSRPTSSPTAAPRATSAPTSTRRCSPTTRTSRPTSRTRRPARSRNWSGGGEVPGGVDPPRYAAQPEGEGPREMAEAGAEAFMSRRRERVRTASLRLPPRRPSAGTQGADGAPPDPAACRSRMRWCCRCGSMPASRRGRSSEAATGWNGATSSPRPTGSISAPVHASASRHGDRRSAGGRTPTARWRRPSASRWSRSTRRFRGPGIVPDWQGLTPRAGDPGGAGTRASSASAAPRFPPT